jgi:hypothetical protein
MASRRCSPAPSQTHVLNAPNPKPDILLAAVARPVVLRLGVSRRETKRPLSAASTGLAEWSFWNPSGSDRRDPNTLAPNRRKLGRLQRARQGVVRVPESNTKYGGKRGKRGGQAHASSGQVSVSPQGFPREKNCDWRPPASFTPLFTGGSIFLADILRQRDSRKVTEIRLGIRVRYTRLTVV